MATAVPATPFTIPKLAGRRNEITFTQAELHNIAKQYLPREGGITSRRTTTMDASRSCNTTKNLLSNQHNPVGEISPRHF
jgi:hypothetical protein